MAPAAAVEAESWLQRLAAEWNGAATPTVLVASMVVLVTATLLLPRSRSARSSSATGGGGEQAPNGGLTGGHSEARGQNKQSVNLEGTFVPSTGVLHANSGVPYAFDNEHSAGQVLPLHRPTMDKEIDAKGTWLYGSHFKGRKRLWEIRLQLTFKEDVSEALRFGIELEDYVPLGSATKRLMGLTVAALRQVAGSDLYHSAGDDPKTTTGPLEKPTFTMPLWAFDQMIVTPEGETPPDLTDAHFSDFGHKRADNRAAFIEEMSKLELKRGPTYTFAFWGISQFLDNIKWQVMKVVPFTTIDFNQFCGAPPVHIVLYTLRPEEGETRHLQRRKEYYFHLAFWSSRSPPSSQKLKLLLPEDSQDVGARAQRPRRGGWRSLFTCCVQQRHPDVPAT